MRRSLNIAVAVVVVLGCLWILPDYGMGWDEPTRWRSGDSKIAYYAGFRSAESWWKHTQAAPRDLYPGLFDIPLALSARALPVDRFYLGHLWSLLFGLSGAAAVWLTARRIAQADAWIPTGLAAGCILLLIPDYFGHMFINPKDIPFAAMYAWGVLALVGFVAGFPRPSWKATVFLGLGAGLCMAVRIPGGVLLVYAALLAGLWLLVQRPRKGAWLDWMGDAGVLAARGIAAAGIALLTLLPWWPSAHRSPFRAPAEAVGDLHSFSAAIPVLYRGRLFEAGETPAGYGIWMFLITVPEWFLVLMGAGLIAMFVRRKHLASGIRSGDSRTWMRAAVLLAALFPLVYVSIAQPAIHNGFRHLLYILPPFAVLGSLALEFGGRAWVQTPRGRALAFIAIGAVVLLSTFHLVRLHPYQYVYYNALIGGTAGSYGRYETEYWFTSTQHGFELLEAWIEDHPEARPPGDRPVRVLVSGPWQVAQPFLPAGFELTSDPHAADFFVANTQMMIHTLYDGEVIGLIERMGLPILVIKRLNPGARDSA